MSSINDRIAQMRKELDALQLVQTQEDFDEGARLHAEKNAPWVNGMYSHLKFTPYVYQEFPKAMYRHDYHEKYQAWVQAQALLVSGNDQSRDLAIKAATRDLDLTVCQVGDAVAERQRFSQGWRATQAEALALHTAQENEIALQAAHLNYEDRNLTGKALEERELADELSDGHLVDVTGTLANAKRGRPRRVAVGA